MMHQATRIGSPEFNYFGDLAGRRQYLKLCYLINDSPLMIRSMRYATRSHTLTLHVPFASRTDSFLYSFFCHTSSLWNSLPSTRSIITIIIYNFKCVVMAQLQTH